MQDLGFVFSDFANTCGNFRLEHWPETTLAYVLQWIIIFSRSLHLSFSAFNLPEQAMVAELGPRVSFLQNFLYRTQKCGA